MRTRVLLVLAVALVVGSIAVGAAGVEPEHTGVLNDPNGSDGNLFGYSVAIDGDTVVVGTIYGESDVWSSGPLPHANPEPSPTLYVSGGSRRSATCLTPEAKRCGTYLVARYEAMFAVKNGLG